MFEILRCYLVRCWTPRRYNFHPFILGFAPKLGTIRTTAIAHLRNVLAVAKTLFSIIEVSKKEGKCKNGQRAFELCYLWHAWHAQRAQCLCRTRMEVVVGAPPSFFPRPWRIQPAIRPWASWRPHADPLVDQRQTPRWPGETKCPNFFTASPFIDHDPLSHSSGQCWHIC